MQGPAYEKKKDLKAHHLSHVLKVQSYKKVCEIIPFNDRLHLNYGTPSHFNF
jgi:hypothetical protein